MTNPKFIEPVGNEKGGWWKEEEGRSKAYARRIATAWEMFLQEEGLPVYEGIGVKDSRELPRSDWPRLGGKGTYIQLFQRSNGNPGACSPSPSTRTSVSSIPLPVQPCCWA